MNNYSAVVLRYYEEIITHYAYEELSGYRKGLSHASTNNCNQIFLKLNLAKFCSYMHSYVSFWVFRCKMNMWIFILFSLGIVTIY